MNTTLNRVIKRLSKKYLGRSFTIALLFTLGMSGCATGPSPEELQADQAKKAAAEAAELASKQQEAKQKYDLAATWSLQERVPLLIELAQTAYPSELSTNLLTEFAELLEQLPSCSSTEFSAFLQQEFAQCSSPTVQISCIQAGPKSFGNAASASCKIAFFTDSRSKYKMMWWRPSLPLEKGDDIYRFEYGIWAAELYIKTPLPPTDPRKITFALKLQDKYWKTSFDSKLELNKVVGL